MKKPGVISLIMLFLTGYGLVGCESQSSQPNTLFDSSPCRAPCWQNVTPGVTTEQDALPIFKKFANKEGVVIVNNQVPDGFDDDIRFGPNDKVSIFVRSLDGRISVMQFEGQFGGPLTVQHAIELFGEPENVLVEYGAEHYQVTLFNSTKGIAFGWIITGFTPMAINPNTAATLVWFFDPSQFDRFVSAHYLNISADPLNNGVHPWTGYGNLKDKYLPPFTLP